MARGRTVELRGMSRIEARIERIRGLNRMVLAVVCLGMGAVVLASALPECKRLAAMEGELAATEEREAEVRGQKEASEVALEALREDPDYLEVMARDRLDFSLPGERVLRIERER